MTSSSDAALRRSDNDLTVITSAVDNVVERNRVVVDGVGIDPLERTDVVRIVNDSLEQGRGGWIVTPNLDIMRQARTGPVRSLIESADLVVADGMPLVVASWLQGERLPERVTGVDLVGDLSAMASQSDRSVYLLGGGPGVAGEAANALKSKFMGLRVGGWHSPPFGFENQQEHVDDIIRRLSKSKPDVVFVALGFPKQEKLIRELRSRFSSTWFLGCGGALDMWAGNLPRAPHWVRAVGAEWAHRLSLEPKRLAERYLRHGIPYCVALTSRAASKGLARRYGSSAKRRSAPGHGSS